MLRSATFYGPAIHAAGQPTPSAARRARLAGWIFGLFASLALCASCGNEPTPGGDSPFGTSDAGDRGGAGDIADQPDNDSHGDSHGDSGGLNDGATSGSGQDGLVDGDDAVPDAASDQDAVGVDAAEADATADGDGSPVVCTPACTLDELCTAGGCQAVPKPCGGACTAGQFCDQSAGTDVCVTSACALPTSFSNVQKVSYMEIAPSSKGCDLDGDGTVDNVFGKLLKVYPAANTELLKSIQDGLFILLFHAETWKTDGTVFVINGYIGELDGANSSCSPTAAFTNCKYTIGADNFGPGPSGTCPAQVRLQPSTVVKDQLDAGGTTGTTMTITLPVVGGLDVTLSNARIRGEVTTTPSWQTTKKGRICGVMTVVDFNKAIDAVPADAWKQIGLDKALVAQVLATFLAPDIDLNKDGTNDAISMALLFEGVPGQITAVTP